MVAFSNYSQVLPSIAVLLNGRVEGELFKVQERLHISNRERSSNLKAASVSVTDRSPTSLLCRWHGAIPVPQEQLSQRV